MSKAEYHRVIVSALHTYIERAQGITSGTDQQRSDLASRIARAISTTREYAVAAEDGNRGDIVMRQAEARMAFDDMFESAHEAGVDGELPQKLPPNLARITTVVPLMNRNGTPPSGSAELAERFRLRARQRKGR